MTSIDAVIVNWNGEGFLAPLLESLKAQRLAVSEILIIDNGSTDGRLADITRRFPDISVIVNATNHGFAHACNQAIRKTKGDWVLVLNPDVWLSADFILEAIRASEGDDRIGAVCGKTLRFDRKTLDTTGQFLSAARRVVDRGYGRRDRGQFDTPGYVFSVCAAVGLYRRRMLEDIAIQGEYFDEDFFAFYEDMDLMWRAQRRGWKAFYEPRAVAFHFRGGTNLRDGRGWRGLDRFQFHRRPRGIQRHILKNRYLMMIKNDRLRDVFKNFPFVLAYDLLLWGYVLIFKPVLILDFLKEGRSFMKALEKRKHIRKKTRREKWEYSTS